MPVTNKEQTPEEKAAEQKAVKEKEDKITDELLGDLDEPKLKETEGKKVKVKEEPEEEPEESEDEESPEEPEDEPEDETEEEDLIPKSKLEKRIKSELAKRRILEERVKELEERSSKSSDSRRDKLEKMSETELKSLKRDARSRWKKTEDTGEESQLEELMDEIDDVMRTASKRFEKAQTEEYDKEARRIMSDPKNDEIDFEADAPKIKKIASEVYKKYPDFRNMKRGQAIALSLAVDHFRESLKQGKGSENTKKLKREVNKMKRKTSLDSSSVKGNKQARTRQLYEKAKKGDFYDKLDYIDNLIDVDRYLD